MQFCHSTQAKRRMFLDGKKALAASQEEPEVGVTLGLTDLHALNNSTNKISHNNTTNPDNRAETSRHSRFFLPKVGTLSSPLPGFAFFEKFLQKYLRTHSLICIYVSSEEAEQSKRKQKSCLVLPGYMQKLNKPIDFLKKSCVQKIRSRSARFKRLADTQNIYIVYQNKPSIKKLLSQNKDCSLIKNILSKSGQDPIKILDSNMGHEKI